MKTYKFLGEIEQDGVEWLVRYPTMERYGGFAGGYQGGGWFYRQEILTANIETMLELGITIPGEPEDPVSQMENQRFITVQPRPELSPREGLSPKACMFQAAMEPDEDAWAAYCPTLEGQGSATWSETYEEAYINIHQVPRMTLQA